MRRVMLVACCILSLSIPLIAQARRPEPQPVATPRPPYQHPVVVAPPYQRTWYDAMLRQFNPDNLDWGQWLEQRREQFLEQTVANPYFKYSMVTTLLLVVLSVAFAKTLVDKIWMLWLAQERYDDVLRQDALSRKEAHAAIRRYNEHVEKCNRMIEAELAGPRFAAIGAAAPDGQATSADRLVEAANLRRERDALVAELEASRAMVGDLTTRINGTGIGGNGAAGTSGAATGGATPIELVKQINELREQLYHERERNKQLKGL